MTSIYTIFIAVCVAIAGVHTTVVFRGKRLNATQRMNRAIWAGLALMWALMFVALAVYEAVM